MEIIPMGFLGNWMSLTGRGGGAAMAAATLCLSIQAGAAGDRRSDAAETNRLPYEYETHALRFEDLLVLHSGAAHVGKAMEWSNKILLFDQSGRRRVFDVPEVELFLTRRTARHHRKPERPDLTAAWIERTPRVPPVLIRDGTAVRFRVRVLNAGGAASAASACRILLDSEEVHRADVPALGPGRSHFVEFTWSWRAGPRRILVEIAPSGASREIVKWNNTFSEPLRAQSVVAIVARDRYESYRRMRNLVDTFCFEDWFQYQLRNLNALFAASIHPSSPDGIVERVRCDRVLVVDDPQIAVWPQDCPAVVSFPPLDVLEDPAELAGHVDWRMLQDVARNLGLADLAGANTRLEQCMVRDAVSPKMYLQRRYRFPRRRTFMYAPGGFPFSEPSAAYLNRLCGKERGVRGEYLYQLPETITLDIRSNDGGPAAEVDVEVFQRMNEGRYTDAIAGADEPSFFAAVTDSTGKVTLPNRAVQPAEASSGYPLRPNPFGQIAIDGSNGLLLLRLRRQGSEEIHFLSLFDCNVAFLRGSRREYLHRIDTRFGPAGAPRAPNNTSIRSRDVRDGDSPDLYVAWPFPAETAQEGIREFRVYRRTGFGGNETKPWTLHRIVRPESGRWKLEADIRYHEGDDPNDAGSLDTFFRVSAVDRLGLESDLSPVQAVVTHDKRHAGLAVDSDGQAYISIRGPGEGQLMHYNGSVGTQPYGVRMRGFGDYKPDFAGLAVDPSKGLLVAADPSNHVIAFYHEGNLTRTIPARHDWPGVPGAAPGSFDSPSDVAVGAGGTLFVADAGNNRVQIIDASGASAGMVDPAFEFDRPSSLGLANDHLCVTDQSGARLRVYRLNGTQSEFVCQVSDLVEADRALVGPSGRIYVAARDPASEAWAILRYERSGSEARLLDAKTTAEGQGGEIIRPRGLYPYEIADVQYAYFVNRLPFNVRRIVLD